MGRLNTDSATSLTSFSSADPPVITIPDEESIGVWNTTTLSYDPYPASTIRTKLEFITLFTDAEIGNILTEAKTNSNVAIFLKKVELAGEIDLADQRTINGVNWLEANGIIGAGRASEVLNG